MKHLKEAFILAAVLIVVLLAILLYNEISAEPLGMCEEQQGSVCSAEARCPAGFSPTLQYVCTNEDWTCCVPS